MVGNLLMRCQELSCRWSLRTVNRHSCGLQETEETGGAELFLVELLLDFLESEDWDLDLGLSAAMAAITSMATGQNHSWS